jgi:hypothetical protein
MESVVEPPPVFAHHRCLADFWTFRPRITLRVSPLSTPWNVTTAVSALACHDHVSIVRSELSADSAARGGEALYATLPSESRRKKYLPLEVEPTTRHTESEPPDQRRREKLWAVDFRFTAIAASEDRQTAAQARSNVMAVPEFVFPSNLKPSPRQYDGGNCTLAAISAAKLLFSKEHA